MVRKTLLILLLALVFVPFSAVQGQQATFGSLHATLVGDDLTAATLPSGVGIGLDYSPVIGQTQLLIEEAIPGEYVVSFPDLSTHNELAALCSYAVGSPECELNNQSLFTRPGIDCYIGTCSYVLNVERGRVTKIAIIYLDAASPPERLNVAKQGTGTGTVTGGPISCGSVCTATVPSGTTVNLSASSSPDSIFTGWFGPCTGTGICTIRVGATRTVVARFDLKPVPPKPSVLFIPGFMGSRLYMSSTSERVWEKPIAGKELFLDPTGKSINEIHTKDVIDTINAPSPLDDVNIYVYFINFLNDEKRIEGLADWKPFPYDWRLNPDDILTNGVRLPNGQIAHLEDSISQLAASSGQVTIIAHSNGGLLAKAFIKKLEDEGRTDILKKIDKVILVAVPQLGTPKALKALLHGESFGFAGLGLSQISSRKLGENMPGAYNFVPSNKYFEKVFDPVIMFDKSATSTFGKYYGSLIKDYDELKDFLLAIKDQRPKPKESSLNNPNILNSALFPNAESFHSELDNFTPPEGISFVEIAGWGQDTIQGIKYFVRHQKVREKFPETIDGDGTVVISSAITKPGFYIVDLRNSNIASSTNLAHKDILSASSTQHLIQGIMSNQPFELPPFITATLPDAPFDKRLHFSIFSPVEINAFNQTGIHTGIIDAANELYEEAIPNSYYFQVGDSKYLGLPADQTNQVTLKGTDFGTFTLEIEQVTGNNSTTSIFTDIPVSPTMRGSIDFINNIPQIKVDTEGDGKVDFVVLPRNDLDPLLYAKMLQSIVKSMKLYSSVEESILEDLSDIIKEVKDKDFDDAREIRNDIREDLLDPEWKEEKITSDQRSRLLSLFNPFVIGSKDPLPAIVLVEELEMTVRAMHLYTSVEDSILEKLAKIKDELEEEDIDDAEEYAEKLLKNLNDFSWKTGKITLGDRNTLADLVSILIDTISELK